MKREECENDAILTMGFYLAIRRRGRGYKGRWTWALLDARRDGMMVTNGDLIPQPRSYLNEATRF